jgi:hypothetical protein
MTVIELRQYTLRPGMRDVLIELFEADLEPAQEQCGMRILGMFRDVEDPQRFVWLRAFAAIEDRARSLSAFYGGPVWRRHRLAANATMIDSDDVLLLRPGWPGSQLDFDLDPSARRAGADRGIVQAGIVSFTHAVDGVDLMYFCDEIVPELERVGARVLGCLVSESAANDFPALPIRENENVLVWLAAFPDRIAYAAARNLRYDIAPAIQAWPGVIAPLVLRSLAPTRASRLNGTAGGEFVPVHVVGRGRCA